MSETSWVIEQQHRRFCLVCAQRIARTQGRIEAKNPDSMHRAAMHLDCADGLPYRLAMGILRAGCNMPGWP